MSMLLLYSELDTSSLTTRKVCFLGSLLASPQGIVVGRVFFISAMIFIDPYPSLISQPMKVTILPKHEAGQTESIRKRAMPYANQAALLPAPCCAKGTLMVGGKSAKHGQEKGRPDSSQVRDLWPFGELWCHLNKFSLETRFF